MAISVDERKYSNLCIQSALLSDELNKLRRVVRNHPNNMDKIHTQIHLRCVNLSARLILK